MATTEELHYVAAVLESERLNEWSMTPRERIVTAQGLVARLIAGEELTDLEKSFVGSVLQAQYNKVRYSLTSRRARLVKAIAIWATV